MRDDFLLRSLAILAIVVALSPQPIHAQSAAPPPLPPLPGATQNAEAPKLPALKNIPEIPPAKQVAPTQMVEKGWVDKLKDFVTKFEDKATPTETRTAQTTLQPTLKPVTSAPELATMSPKIVTPPPSDAPVMDALNLGSETPTVDPNIFDFDEKERKADVKAEKKEQAAQKKEIAKVLADLPTSPPTPSLPALPPQASVYSTEQVNVPVLPNPLPKQIVVAVPEAPKPLKPVPMPTPAAIAAVKPALPPVMIPPVVSLPPVTPSLPKPEIASAKPVAPALPAPAAPVSDKGWLDSLKDKVMPAPAAPAKTEIASVKKAPEIAAKAPVLPPLPKPTALASADKPAEKSWLDSLKGDTLIPPPPAPPIDVAETKKTDAPVLAHIPLPKTETASAKPAPVSDKGWLDSLKDKVMPAPTAPAKTNIANAKPKPVQMAANEVAPPLPPLPPLPDSNSDFSEKTPPKENKPVAKSGMDAFMDHSTPPSPPLPAPKPPVSKTATLTPTAPAEKNWLDSLKDNAKTAENTVKAKAENLASAKSATSNTEKSWWDKLKDFAFHRDEESKFMTPKLDAKNTPPLPMPKPVVTAAAKPPVPPMLPPLAKNDGALPPVSLPTLAEKAPAIPELPAPAKPDTSSDLADLLHLPLPKETTPPKLPAPKPATAKAEKPADTSSDLADLLHLPLPKETAPAPLPTPKPQVAKVETPAIPALPAPAPTPAKPDTTSKLADLLHLTPSKELTPPPPPAPKPEKMAAANTAPAMPAMPVLPPLPKVDNTEKAAIPAPAPKAEKLAANTATPALPAIPILPPMPKADSSAPALPAIPLPKSAMAQNAPAVPAVPAQPAIPAPKQPQQIAAVKTPAPALPPLPVPDVSLNDLKLPGDAGKKAATTPPPPLPAHTANKPPAINKPSAADIALQQKAPAIEHGPGTANTKPAANDSIFEFGELNNKNKKQAEKKPGNTNTGAPQIADISQEDPAFKFWKGHNFNTQVLPEVINRKEYETRNSHLPKAVYKEDLQQLLFLAAGRGDLNAMRALLDNGADLEAKNAIGDTPLVHAAINGQAGAVRVLLARGANPNAPNAHGMTAMQVAAERGREDIIDALFEMGAKSTADYRNPMTPLQSGVTRGYASVYNAMQDGQNPQKKQLDARSRALQALADAGPNPRVVVSQGQPGLSQQIIDDQAKKKPGEPLTFDEIERRLAYQEYVRKTGEDPAANAMANGTLPKVISPAGAKATPVPIPYASPQAQGPQQRQNPPPPPGYVPPQAQEPIVGLPPEQKTR